MVREGISILENSVPLNAVPAAGGLIPRPRGFANAIAVARCSDTAIWTHLTPGLAAEAQKVLDNRGRPRCRRCTRSRTLVLPEPGTWRAMPREASKARGDFFAVRKDADPDLPVLIEAKRDFEKK